MCTLSKNIWNLCQRVINLIDGSKESDKVRVRSSQYVILRFTQTLISAYFSFLTFSLLQIYYETIASSDYKIINKHMPGVSLLSL